jgi:hypothetical protein
VDDVGNFGDIVRYVCFLDHGSNSATFDLVCYLCVVESYWNHYDGAHSTRVFGGSTLNCHYPDGMCRATSKNEFIKLFGSLHVWWWHMGPIQHVENDDLHGSPFNLLGERSYDSIIHTNHLGMVSYDRSVPIQIFDANVVFNSHGWNELTDWIVDEHSSGRIVENLWYPIVGIFGSFSCRYTMFDYQFHLHANYWMVSLANKRKCK